MEDIGQTIVQKDFKPMLNNYNLCIKRYNALRRQLSKDPVLEKAYTEEIHKLIQKGNVEKVDENPLFASDPNRYLNYLPQVCVARQDKISSKVRPVFDASFHNNQSISLNDNLYQGPKTQGSIFMITDNLTLFNPSFFTTHSARGGGIRGSLEFLLENTIVDR